MEETKRDRYFIRNPESGEPWRYCGDKHEVFALVKAIGDFAWGEIENDFGGSDGDTFALEIKRVPMTDAEVDKIEDM